ncbi:N-acetylglucosaminyl-diphospho-decaprenol L-rhamnosyltransferase [compost metagenome]
MKIFVIVIIYNGMRNDWIQKCFSSIIASNTSVEIIAVDNNSSDESVQFIKNNFPKTILVESNVNLGFGGANNLGLKYALKQGGEYFLLLNQDARVQKNTIENLVNISIQNTEYGVISPIHLNGDGSALDFNFSNYISPNKCKNLYSDFALRKVENKLYESNFICAAAWLVTKDCLEKVGGFNPSFFHYAEDDNYIHRLKFKGLKIGVYPDSFIYHDREQRDNSKHFNKEVIRERDLLLQFSNPNSSIDFRQKIKIINNKIIKNTLLLNPKEINRLKTEKKTLTKIYNSTFNNLKLSKEDKKYIFIND